MAKLKQRDENEKKRVRGLFFDTKKHLVLPLNEFLGDDFNIVNTCVLMYFFLLLIICISDIFEMPN